jgi:hypothetical protein
MASGRSGHVVARAPVAGAGHCWRGGQACGQECGVDFSLSAEQPELTEAAVALALGELNRHPTKRKDTGEFPREAKLPRRDVGGL